MGNQLHSHTIKESVGHPVRGTTVVTESFHDNTLPLSEVLAILSATVVSIPAQYIDSARFTVHEEWWDVTWERPETDEEWTARKAWLQGLDDDKEKRERAIYERLKQMYDAPAAAK